MASGPRNTRAIDRLADAAQRGDDLVTFWRTVAPTLGRVVPHFETPCFFTVDPGSLLITSHFQEGLPEIPAEWLAREYTAPDYNSLAAVFASPDGLGTLYDATGGRPELATKYHEEMVPYGCEQELVLALRTRDEELWGAVGLYREPGQPLFSHADKAFLRAAAPILAEGARRGLLYGEAVEPDLPDAPGAVVLTADLRVASYTDSALPLLAALGGSPADLPAALTAVAGAGLAATEHEDRTEAQARTRTLGGEWLVLHASPLMDGNGGDRRVLVILEQAQPSRVAPLLMSAYQLTPRERDVAALALAGHSTSECAARLSIAEYTVQQHLQRIFDKTGVRSRRELTSRVFGSHYEPRVRDNEARTEDERSARGGPMPA